MDKDNVEEKKTETTSQTPEKNTGPKTISAEDVKKESVKAEKDKKTQKKEKKELKKSLKKKKKKEKTDFVNILLIFAIFLFLIIIITPPVLRKLMPKLEEIKPGEKENAIILACTAYNKEEQYEITSRSKYVNEVLTQNIVTYKKVDPEKLTTIPANKITTISIPSSEIAFFKTIRGIDISEKSSMTVITLYDYIADKYSANRDLNKYFQSKEQQKSFYTSMGYTCEEITS